MKIVIIGAGNLATQLAVNMYNKHFQIVQVLSRTINSAEIIAKKVNASFTNYINDIDQNADLYIIAINDNNIESVVKSEFLKNKFMIHCAGSIDLEIFKSYSCNYGVIYPVQTFTKSKIVDFKNVPLCVEANNDENLILLINIAHVLSENVYEINSEQRKYLHLSAVFANNFTNFFLEQSKYLTSVNSIDFNILQSLVEETVKKAFSEKISNNQTGPAVRGDINVVNLHIKMLKDYPKLKKLYSFVSKSINENLQLDCNDET